MCENLKFSFSRSGAIINNDGCHVEQKNWAIVRTVVGYHRYDTVMELVLSAAVECGELLLPATETRLKGPQRRERSSSSTTRRIPHRHAEHHE